MDERDIWAMRVVPVSQSGELIETYLRGDAGWLVHRCARIGAIGIAMGRVGSDGTELLPCSGDSVQLPSADPELVANDSTIDNEALLLNELRELWQHSTLPLIITCGGRSRDLPFVRYRCLAKDIPIPGLQICARGRFKYFDRFDSGWHIDLADLLAGQGATHPLPLSELCRLVGLDQASATHDGELESLARNEAQLIFSLFLQTLRTTGLFPGTTAFPISAE